MQSVHVRLLAAAAVVASSSITGGGVAQPATGPKKDTAAAPKVDLMAPYRPTCPASYSYRPPGSNIVQVTPGPFTLTTDANGAEDRCVGKQAPTCAGGTLVIDSGGTADACKTTTSSTPPQCPAQGYTLKARPGADECQAGGAFVCPAGRKPEHRAGADLCLPVASCAGGTELASDRSGLDDKCVTASAYSCPSGYHVLVDPRDNSNTQIPLALRPTLLRDVCEKNLESSRTGAICAGGKVQYPRAGADFCYAPTAPTTDPACPTELKLFRETGRDVCAPLAYGVNVSP